MRRRRRPHREIAFSFDSFLDVVANVVGIILRLIVFAWIGARSYKAVVSRPPPPPPALAPADEPPEPTDPRAAPLAAAREEAARRRCDVSEREERLLLARREAAARAGELRTLAEERRALAGRAEAAARTGEGGSEAEQASRSVAEMARRAETLLRDVEAARSRGPKHERLHYPAPISRESQEEEAMFEVRKGRVTLLDAGALVKLIREGLDGKAAQLRQAWSVTDVTPAAGAFRARYTVERERVALEAGAAPGEGAFRYGATGWEAVPVSDERGEAVGDALTSGSAFRTLVDALDPAQTVVTLWVYPDSFAAYRRLRDYLHGRGLVVAGRPLPEGAPIGASRGGTASRGQ